MPIALPKSRSTPKKTTIKADAAGRAHTHLGREAGVGYGAGFAEEEPQEVLLIHDEERALAEAIARGDRDARARLIRANLRLVQKIARDFGGRGLDYEDLVGEGNLGLIRAAEQYDPRYGTRFSTYAAHWIRQSIRHALINTTAMIRLPAHMVRLLTLWGRAERRLARELGRPPGREEVAEALELSARQRGMAERALRSRHIGRGNEEGSGPVSLADPGEAPDDLIAADEDREAVMRRLHGLDEPEREVLRLRFGLGDGDRYTLKEIGERIGVTKEWVRKIELRALAKLYAE